MRRHSFVWAVLSLALTAVAALAQPPEWIGKGQPQIRAQRLSGNGSWKSTGRKRRVLQRWSLNIDRDDQGNLRGSVVLNDSPLLESGLVRGSLDGRHLSGTIADASGRDVVEFRGVVSTDGIRGTYTDRTGETGDWVWDGPLPE